jgi:tetratricopeptide (TPR) repeat protein
MALAEKLWLTEPAQARPLLEQALADTATAGDTKARAKAASMLSELCRKSGDAAASERYCRDVFSAARALGDLRVEASGHNLLGMLMQERGAYPEALASFQRCLELGRRTGYTPAEQAALNQLAGIHAMQGRLDEALDCYRQCLDADAKAGDDYGRTSTLYNIGWTLEQAGRWDEAVENLYRSLALAEEHGFGDLRLQASNVLGEILLKRGHLLEATSAFRAVVEAERSRKENRWLLVDALANLGWALARSGELAAAEAAYVEAEQLSRRSRDRRSNSIALWRHAEMAVSQRRFGEAGKLLARASSSATKLHLQREQAEILRVRALLAAERGDADAAARSFRQAAALFDSLGNGYELARCRLQHGRWLAARGEADPARRLLRSAAEAFRRFAAVAESEETSRLLFDLELGGDRTSAVLEGLSGLLPAGLHPQ